jgi:hypothetical protein
MTTASIRSHAGPFLGLDHGFVITTQDAALAEALTCLYAPLRVSDTGRSGWVEYAVEPPTPGELWQLRVDGRVTVRSSTPGGVVRMLLRSVADAIRRGPSPVDPPGPRGALQLDGAAVEIDGTGVLLLAGRGVDLAAVLIRLLRGSGDAVGYLGETAVHLDTDALALRGAATPLSLHQDRWDAEVALRELVPDGVVPYLDLAWPLPAPALGRVADTATLGLVVQLEIGDASAARGGEALRPTEAVTCLLDRLPTGERTDLTVERLRQVATVAEQVDVVRLVAGPEPGAVAEAVRNTVRVRCRPAAATSASG